jgi:hypothetical protein
MSISQLLVAGGIVESKIDDKKKLIATAVEKERAGGA